MCFETEIWNWHWQKGTGLLAIFVSFMVPDKIMHYFGDAMLNPLGLELEFPQTCNYVWENVSRLSVNVMFFHLFSFWKLHTSEMKLDASIQSKSDTGNYNWN